MIANHILGQWRVFMQKSVDHHDVFLVRGVIGGDR